MADILVRDDSKTHCINIAEWIEGLISQTSTPPPVLIACDTEGYQTSRWNWPGISSFFFYFQASTECDQKSVLSSGSIASTIDWEEVDKILDS